MEILISYAPYRHQRYSSTNSLKRTAVCMVKERVCFPYEFTLLSNSRGCLRTHCTVCFPYEFTLLSNYSIGSKPFYWFVSPTNLHCSQTYITFLWYPDSFVSPTNLHCSQTSAILFFHVFCLFPLRIYTALKPNPCLFLLSQVCFPYEFTLLSNLKSSKNNILQNTRVPS